MTQHNQLTEMLRTQLMLGTLVVIVSVVFHVSALVYLSGLLTRFSVKAMEVHPQSGMLISAWLHCPVRAGHTHDRGLALGSRLLCGW